MVKCEHCGEDVQYQPYHQCVGMKFSLSVSVIAELCDRVTKLEQQMKGCISERSPKQEKEKQDE